MTDDDLDQVEAAALVERESIGDGHDVETVLALVRLARRGLRAERETCGTCARGSVLMHMQASDLLFCDWWGSRVSHADACTSWCAKEGA